MTKSNCTFAEQKQTVAEFLRIYKHKFCIHDQHTNLSMQHIKRIANAKNYDKFFDAVCDVRLKIGNSNYFIFSCNPDERHKALSVMMPVCIDNMRSDVEVDKFIEHRTIVDLITTEHCEFVNITPRRWRNFAKMFNSKAISNVRVENEIAYLDIYNIVKYYAATCSNMSKDNSQIDNAIVSYRECANLFLNIVDELQNAKEQGVIKVVAEYM